MNSIRLYGFDVISKNELLEKLKSNVYDLNVSIKQILFLEKHPLEIYFEKDGEKYMLQSNEHSVQEITLDLEKNDYLKSTTIEIDASRDGCAPSVSILFDRVCKYTFMCKTISIFKL